MVYLRQSLNSSYNPYLEQKAIAVSHRGNVGSSSFAKPVKKLNGGEELFNNFPKLNLSRRESTSTHSQFSPQITPLTEHPANKVAHMSPCSEANVE